MFGHKGSLEMLILTGDGRMMESLADFRGHYGSDGGAFLAIIERRANNI